MELNEITVGFGYESKQEKKKKTHDSSFSSEKQKSKKTYRVLNTGYNDIIFDIDGKKYEFKRTTSKDITEDEFLELSENNVLDFYRGILVVELIN